MAGESEVMGLMAKMPWWSKLGLKLLLSRLPLSYGFWRGLGLFRHGYMDDPERAIRTYEKYQAQALPQAGFPPDFQVLELGPGDSILSGLVARAHGAGKVWLVDAGDFADTDVAACQQITDVLRKRGLALPLIANASSTGDVLRALDVHYLKQGTKSLAQIPDASIDFFWSQVVLEHVPRDEFTELLRELRRVLKPNGVGAHSIDFRDHLGGGLSNLRFRRAVWEGRFFSGGGFYTNRLRPREMLAMFRQAGFSVEQLGETRWPAMPIRRKDLAPEFRALPDEDFMVAEIEVLLRPQNA
jgi:SAM-dependent methyltransferase